MTADWGAVYLAASLVIGCAAGMLARMFSGRG
jgi:hypothetical protein